MSTQSSTFESISLEPTVPNLKSRGKLLDFSDDELDPEDFLSQSQTGINRKMGDANDSVLDTSSEKEGSFLYTKKAHSEHETHKLWPSQRLSFEKDSLHFTFNNSGERVQKSKSPLEHLLKRQDGLEKEMNKVISLHKQVLKEGYDCSGIRETITQIFAALSENFLLLEEVYSKEASGVDETLSEFHTWDKRRNKVLKRIKQTNSKNNIYGAKLVGLMERKCTMDHDIEALESRLTSLKKSRLTLEREMGETLSVLESRSAKYINMFRNLEKIGIGAVLDYLDAEGVKEPAAFLRYQAVDVEFSDFWVNIKGQKTKEPLIEPSSPTIQKNASKVVSQSSIGARAFEVSDYDLNRGTGDSNFNSYTSAYEKGYAKGSQQFSEVKKKLSDLLTNVLPSAQDLSRKSHIFSKPIDSQNAIYKKLDLKPLVDLLISKSEVLRDMVLQTARVSESFRIQKSAWSEITRFLDTQEENLRSSLINASDVRVAETSLIEVFEFLELQLKFSETFGQSCKVAENYVKVLLGQEVFTVATALDQISGENTYTLSLILTHNMLEPSSKDPKTPRDLKYSITSISSEQHNVIEQTAEISKKRFQKSSKYKVKSSKKDVKNE